MKSTKTVIIGFAVLFCWSGSLFADYTLLLKNGRRITVKRYREEDGKIKVYGLGGEIGIAREQIESIIRVEEGKGQGMVLPDEEPSSDEAVGTRQEEEKVASPGPSGGGRVEENKEEPVDNKEKAKTPEELREERRAKEEKEYQKRVREVTGRIKALMDRYSLATGRGSGPEPRLLNSEEAIKGRTADLMSRLRDRQYNPAGPSDAGKVEVFTGGSKSRELRRGVVRPRVRVPQPPYSAKEKELSKLRAQSAQLRKERDRLIQEMRRKDFDTGSLFLE